MGCFFNKNTNLLKLRGTFERCNLHYSDDLLNERGAIYGYEEICTLLNKRLNFVDYYSLKHSIPRKWRSGLKDKLYCRKHFEGFIKHFWKNYKTQ